MGTKPLNNHIITGHACLEQGAMWLSRIEPRFALILPRILPLPLRMKPAGFGPLLQIILGQQVSVSSANSLWSKLQVADITTAVALRSVTQEDLRVLGLSQQKARCALVLAKADINFDRLNYLPTHQVIKSLCVVKSIGMWTAEVYCIFLLRRADVLAAGDLAIQESAKFLFDLVERPTERRLREMANAWSPWRSVAARLLWAYYATIKQKDGII